MYSYASRLKKTTQFSLSQLLSLLFNRFWQKLLLFLHRDIFFFLFNFWYIHDLLAFPFAIVLVKLYLTPKSGFACYCSDALKSLSLFHYLNRLIYSPKILKENCIAHFSALTRSVTVNKSTSHPMVVINNIQNTYFHR